VIDGGNQTQSDSIGIWLVNYVSLFPDDPSSHSLYGLVIPSEKVGTCRDPLIISLSIAGQWPLKLLVLVNTHGVQVISAVWAVTGCMDVEFMEIPDIRSDWLTTSKTYIGNSVSEKWGPEMPAVWRRPSGSWQLAIAENKLDPSVFDWWDNIW
jgi:hypothetical protein